tara:strand:- start:1534 stop:1764 length:231 start_codon:yes stop_codon:yes gene_type:complete
LTPLVLLLWVVNWGFDRLRHDELIPFMMFFDDDIESFDSDVNNKFENCPEVTNDEVLVIDLDDLAINKTRKVTILA